MLCFIVRAWRKYPLLGLSQVLAMLIAVPAFISTVSFLKAVSPQQAMHSMYGHPMPAEWSAGVWNHDHYYRWCFIAEHPALFWISVVLLVMAILFLWASILWMIGENRKI